MKKRCDATIPVVLLACVSVFGSACDPRDSLENQEYRSYLDQYERWDIPDAVAAFNQLETKRGDFSCHRELEAAQRSIRREEGGPIKAENTEPVKAFRVCLETFGKAAAVDQTRVQAVVLSDWVNHNFLPDVQKRIDGENSKVQQKIDGSGCGGEACKELTVVNDLAMPRLGSKDGVSFWGALEACASADLGGLRPWRLPTKAELSAILESERVPSEPSKASYWSADRAFSDGGEVNAWVLRVQPISGSKRPIAPELVPFRKRGLPVKGKVRCVYELVKREVSSTEVDDMERLLVDAGCDREGWSDHLRARKGLVVMWDNLGKSGKALDEACRDLDWCGLTWSAPSSAQIKTLTADPWFGESAANRCVAKLP